MKKLPVLLTENQVCMRKNCDQRIPPSEGLMRYFRHTTIAQVLFLMVASMFLGGNLSLLVHAQPGVGTQVAIHSVQIISLEDQIKTVDARLKGIDDEIVHISNEISVIQGVGIGFSSLLIALQILQIAISRKSSE